MFSSDNFNTIYRQLIMSVQNNGQLISPRGYVTKELLGYSFCLTNPLNSLCTLKARKLNYKFALIEKLEYLSGSSDPSRICHYNKNMASFINEKTGEFDGAYPPRIGRQLEYIIELLRRDPSTRQAIININNEGDKHETRDVPCTVSLQFLLRDNKLNLIVYMRSNDLLWGTPYDVNGFCFLQEAIATWLCVELGDYIHFAGSLHYYKEREDQLLKLTKIIEPEDINDEKNTIFNIGSYLETMSEFDKFWKLEGQLREKKLDLNEINQLHPFFQSVINKLI